MEYRTGNLLNSLQDYNYILCTTNSYIKKDDSLVMGHGFAKDIKLAYDGIDMHFGNIIKNYCGHLGTYGVLFYGSIGIFQVKFDFKATAQLDLITYSTQQLCEIANKHSNHWFALNCPTIGNEKQSIDDIDPIIRTLPDNVHIWRK